MRDNDEIYEPNSDPILGRGARGAGENSPETSAASRKGEAGYEAALTRFLHAEYEHMSRSYLQNELLGERRVGMLVAVGVAVSFALTSLGLLVLPVFSGKFVFLFAAGLGGVLLFGLITLVRSVYRNIATDRYLTALTMIRRRFVERHDEEGLEHFYFDPYRRPPRHTHDRVFSLGRGGLVETIALVNSLIVGAIVTLLSIYMFFGPEARDAPTVQVLPFMIFGFSTLSLTWAGQVRYAMRCYKDASMKRA